MERGARKEGDREGTEWGKMQMLWEGPYGEEEEEVREEEAEELEMEEMREQN